MKYRLRSNILFFEISVFPFGAYDFTRCRVSPNAHQVSLELATPNRKTYDLPFKLYRKTTLKFFATKNLLLCLSNSGRLVVVAFVTLKVHTAFSLPAFFCGQVYASDLLRVSFSLYQIAAFNVLFTLCIQLENAITVWFSEIT